VSGYSHLGGCQGLIAKVWDTKESTSEGLIYKIEVQVKHAIGPIRSRRDKKEADDQSVPMTELPGGVGRSNSFPSFWQW